MRTAAVTGAASGIGKAIRARLESEGWRVIGVDLRDVEVGVDLSTERGRQQAVDGVTGLAGGRLDGLVACAGVGPQFEPRETIPSVNYFGAVSLLGDLRPLLAAGVSPAAVAISSNSASIAPRADGDLCRACLDGDEAQARRLAADLHGSIAYAGSKLALARWVRRKAPTPEWAGQGIRLNAVAPGPVLTPLLQGGLDDPTLGPAIRAFPVPLGGMAAPEHLAPVVSFLLGEGARFVTGAVLFADGGTDAMMFPDRP
ncbi:MAG: SDR family oxidoreductase [Alphaproteobacteria bacterium]